MLTHIAKLLALEVVALVFLGVVLKYVVGFDVRTLRTPVVGAGLLVMVVITIYSVLSSGEYAKIGADALYDPRNPLRISSQYAR